MASTTIQNDCIASSATRAMLRGWMSLRTERAAVVGVIVVTLAAYAAVLGGELLFDDTITITGNPVVQGPFSLRAIFGRRAFGSNLWSGAYRPLATLSFWVDQHLVGAPWFFHVVNLALYAFVLWMGHRLLRRWGGGALGAVARVLAIASFAAMAIHVEVVASVTARSELLATAFSLVACDLVVGEAPGVWRVLGAFVALACATLSRESALPMLVFVPLLAARARVTARALVPFATACAVAFVAMIAWRLSSGGVRVVPVNNVLSTYAGPARVAGALDVFTRYLEHVLTGIDLCPDYAYASIVPTGHVGARTVLGGILGAGLVALIPLSWKRWPRAADALVGFGAAFVVSSNVLLPAGGIMGDRFFFFPSFWLCALAALAGTRLARARPRPTGLAVAVAGSAYALAQLSLTFVAVPTWIDRVRFNGASLSACPNNHRLHIGEAGVLSRAGAPREGAWELLTASAIVRRFPRPIDPSTFPQTWNDLPLDVRVQKLRAELGSDDELAEVQRLALVIGNGYGMKAAAAELLRWPTPLAIPPWDPRWSAPSTAAMETPP